MYLKKKFNIDFFNMETECEANVDTLILNHLFTVRWDIVRLTVHAVAVMKYSFRK